MKKGLLVFYLGFLFLHLDAQVVFTDSNLPIVVITTLGSAIIDEEKVTCEMGIINNGVGVRNYITNVYNDYFGFIGIEIRGSTSQQYPKKSYGVETRNAFGYNRNVSILGMPEENDWILYGAYPDKTLLRNELAYSLFARMQPWSPRHVYCELIIDGDYKGVYSFMERVKRDNNRVDIAKLDSTEITGDDLTGGYIIKVDKLTGNSTTTWTSPYQVKLLFQYHDPEDTELTVEQAAYIKNYVTAFENAVYGPEFMDKDSGYAQYINTSTFVDFFLMQELGRTVDGYRSSSFMYKDKDSKGGKLSCGPMWDFNLSYGNADYCSAFDTTGWQYNFAAVCPDFPTEPPLWWPRLLEDPTYKRMVKCRWDELRSTILQTDTINAWIDSIAAYLEESQTRNFLRWDILGVYVNWNYFVGDTYAEEIEYLKYWIEARSNWIDAHLPYIAGECGIVPILHDETLALDFMPLDASRIYPNPFHQAAILELNSNSQHEKYVFVYNVLGEKLKEYHIAAGKTFLEISASAFIPGFYIYQVQENSQIISSGEFQIY